MLSYFHPNCICLCVNIEVSSNIGIHSGAHRWVKNSLNWKAMSEYKKAFLYQFYSFSWIAAFKYKNTHRITYLTSALLFYVETYSHGLTFYINLREVFFLFVFKFCGWEWHSLHCDRVISQRSVCSLKMHFIMINIRM